jgi:hypothetical protein
MTLVVGMEYTPSCSSQILVVERGSVESMMKSLSSAGSCIGGRRRLVCLYIPLEGSSAGLAALGTYEVTMSKGKGRVCVNLLILWKM